MWGESDKADQTKRRYSFLGLHRNYSEADLMELIRLQQQIRL